MKRKLNSDRGFTLAELLIVVAIIGVLVAIAIPIFTSQLERSREAVDLSDVRSAYAEVMMAAITGDTSATYTKDSGQKIYKETDGTYSITVTPLKQQRDNWQTPLPITIGGVSSNADQKYWRGVPGAKGYCEITYHPATSTDDEYVSFYWTGGTDDGDNPDLTPAPTPSIPNGDNETKNDFDSKIDDAGYINWPEQPAEGSSVHLSVIDGQVVLYNDHYYVYKGHQMVNGEYNHWGYFTPTNGQFQLLTGKVHYDDEVTMEEVSQPSLKTLTGGDLYITNGVMFVFTAEGPVEAVPTINSQNSDKWVRIINSSPNLWPSSNNS